MILMQEQDLKARVRRRYKCTTMSDHDQPVAANLLGRRFEAEVPNQRQRRRRPVYGTGSSPCRR
jgi:hypothetical protein